MKVKMTQSIEGRVGDDHWSPRKGAEIEVSDNVGALLCKRNVAKPVAEPDANVETRKADPPKPEPKPDPPKVEPKPETKPSARKRPARRKAGA